MHLSKLELKNLRCFANKEIKFNSKITLIEGYNGSGKTTIVESLYYLCYLRSFRTNITKDLISFDCDNFFLRAQISLAEKQDSLQVGFSATKRLVKINEKQVSSFKDLIENYRVIVLTEEDLNLIKGGPEIRRSFIDQHIYLKNPGWTEDIRGYKAVVDNRNALLKGRVIDDDHLRLWTSQIIDRSEFIRSERLKELAKIESEVNLLLDEHFDGELSVQFEYRRKNWHEDLISKEKALERTLFGAHLDDYRINLNHKSTRKFASRGQQKLVSILLKAVQTSLLKRDFGGVVMLILDDFITDLDDQKSEILIKLLGNLDAQLVFTAPNMPENHKILLKELGATTITI